jgi:hypothetical protein
VLLADAAQHVQLASLDVHLEQAHTPATRHNTRGT